MSEEKKFSKCEEGGKCLSVEFRVFGKKMKEKGFFWKSCKVRVHWFDFMLIYKFELQREKMGIFEVFYEAI